MLPEGVWTEVRVEGEHLRLFSEHNAQGVQASVYNVRAKARFQRGTGAERGETAALRGYPVAEAAGRIIC